MFPATMAVSASARRRSRRRATGARPAGRQQPEEDENMGALIGFAFGYVVGAKAGPEGLEELRRAWQSISQSEEFKALIATATAYVQNAFSQGGGAVAE